MLRSLGTGRLSPAPLRQTLSALWPSSLRHKTTDVPEDAVDKRYIDRLVVTVQAGSGGNGSASCIQKSNRGVWVVSVMGALEMALACGSVVETSAFPGHVACRIQNASLFGTAPTPGRKITADGGNGGCGGDVVVRATSKCAGPGWARRFVFEQNIARPLRNPRARTRTIPPKITLSSRRPAPPPPPG